MITKDKLEKFERGEIDLKDFTADEQSDLSRLMAGEDVQIEAPAAEPAVKEEKAESAPPDGDVTKDPEADREVVKNGEKKKLGDLYKEVSDQVNTYRQRSESAARQLEETRAELERLKQQAATQVQNPIKDPNAVWSDQHQIDLAAEVARLKAVVESGVRGSQAKLEALEKELADKAKFAELNAFASEFPELRLSRPFEDANAEYIDFTKRLGATPQDMRVVDRYFEDAAFRKDMEARGIKPPKDYERLEKILKVYHEKGRLNYPTYRAVYLDKVLSPQDWQARLSDRYLKGVEDTVNKIAGNRQETTVLDGSSSNQGSVGMTEAQMEAWLVAHPYPRTEAERQTMAQIQTHIFSKSFSQG